MSSPSHPSCLPGMRLLRGKEACSSTLGDHYPCPEAVLQSLCPPREGRTRPKLGTRGSQSENWSGLWWPGPSSLLLCGSYRHGQGRSHQRLQGTTGSCLFQLLEVPHPQFVAPPSLHPHSRAASPASSYKDLVLTRTPQGIQGHPHLRGVSLIPPAKFSLPCEVMCPQAPG